MSKNKIGVYNLQGEMEQLAFSMQELLDSGFKINSIYKALKTKKPYKQKYFLKGEDLPISFIAPYVCEIEGHKFYTNKDAYSFLKISKQGFSMAKKEKRKTVKKINISWGNV